MTHDQSDAYFESWSKCPFCGAYNGRFGRPLSQHRPRCFYKGNADDRSVMVPNHQQMIDEDDKSYLPMMHAMRDLPVMRENLKKALEELEEARKARKVPAVHG